MIISDLTTTSADEQPALETESYYNWAQDRINYSTQQIQEMPSWIASQKDCYSSQIFIESINIDITTFSFMQGKAYRIIKQHYQHPGPKEPLLLIIIGCGGTGKSYVINAY